MTCAARSDKLHIDFLLTGLDGGGAECATLNLAAARRLASVAGSEACRERVDELVRELARLCAALKAGCVDDVLAEPRQRGRPARVPAGRGPRPRASRPDVLRR